MIARLNGAINTIRADPAKLLEAGANVVPQSTEQFAAFIQAESEKYERIIRLTGVKPD